MKEKLEIKQKRKINKKEKENNRKETPRPPQGPWPTGPAGRIGPAAQQLPPPLVVFPPPRLFTRPRAHALAVPAGPARRPTPPHRRGDKDESPRPRRQPSRSFSPACSSPSLFHLARAPSSPPFAINAATMLPAPRRGVQQLRLLPLLHL